MSSTKLGTVAVISVLGTGLSLALSWESAVSGATAGQEHVHGDLGSVSFPISCAPEARAEFERGVALLHHMMYVEARGAFRSVAEAHPECAMAHWGVAMTLFQPLWPTRPGREELEEGWAAAQAARRLAPESPREQAYIAAAAAFFEEPASTDYWGRLHRFEAAMGRVHRAYPEDREAASFYALARLATARNAGDAKAQIAEAAAILLTVYDKEPSHPGAVHYTIHANDVDGRAGESLDVVRSYDEIAPSVPHALHMPTHIYVRLGDWDEVIRWNEMSAAAALNFPAGEKTSHHHIHALDYLIYAHLQRAEDQQARHVLAQMAAEEGYQQTFISAYHLTAMPARYAVERRQWQDAAALPEPVAGAFPWQRFPWPVATHHFARGLGASRTGDLDAARRAVRRLAALRAEADAAGEDYFAKQIEIGRLAVAGWLAHAEGEPTEALRLMRSAAELEAATEKHPVTPGAVQPAYELLGDLLLELDRPAEALLAYQESLRAWPRRFNSLAGAARAAAATGERERAAGYYRELLELADAESDVRPALAEAKAYLEAG